MRRLAGILVVVILAGACGTRDRPAGPGAWQGQAITGGAQAVRGPCTVEGGGPCPTDPGAGPSTTTTTTAAGSSVAVVAAGDIACSATDPNFHGGQGTPAACRMLATAEVASSLHPQDVLELGDLQYQAATLDAFRQSFDLSWGRFNAVAQPALGNHEYADPGAAGYFGYFGARAGARGQGWYSYDEGAWHLVVLNANCGEVGGCGASSAQGRWLQADLAASTKACTLAIWHQPRFSSGNEGDNLDPAPLWSALYQAGADLVLNAHHHQYERYTPMNANGDPDPAHGMTEIVAGTGGKSIDPFNVVEPTSEVRVAAFGVLALDLGPTGYTWRFIDEHGSVLDGGTRACHGKPA